MKTEIVIKYGWVVIAQYDFLITMSKGDVVEMPDGMEYKVDCCLLEIEHNKMVILVK